MWGRTINCVVKGYQSPINMGLGEITNKICKELIDKEEQVLVEYVQSIGFDIDRDELYKALKYDRDQYNQGYMKAMAEVATIIDEHDRLFVIRDGADRKGRPHYCPVKNTTSQDCYEALYKLKEYLNIRWGNIKEEE